MVNWFNINVFIPGFEVEFNGIFSVNPSNNAVTQFFNSNDTNTNILLLNPNPTGNQFIGDNFTLDGTYISKTILPPDFLNYNLVEVVNLWNDDDGSNQIEVRIDGVWDPIPSEIIFDFTPGSDPNPPPPPPPPPPPISNICFPAKTPITTNQGLIDIDKINPEIHTIRNKKIVAVTKTVTQDNYLVIIINKCIYIL